MPLFYFKTKMTISSYWLALNKEQYWTHLKHHKSASISSCLLHSSSTSFRVFLTNENLLVRMTLEEWFLLPFLRLLSHRADNNIRTITYFWGRFRLGSTAMTNQRDLTTLVTEYWSLYGRCPDAPAGNQTGVTFVTGERTSIEPPTYFLEL